MARAKNRLLRHWAFGNLSIREEDEAHHLGILKSVSSSTMTRTNERASKGRSAFFSLNAVGARFGCLHPSTVLKLYKTLCLPSLLFGSELWMLTKTELLMLERVHRKILRTIQGLPTRCPSIALNCLLGIVPVSKSIDSRKLNFLFSILNLNPSSLARITLLERLADHSPSSIIHSWTQLLDEYALPTIQDLLNDLPCSKLSWKNAIKAIMSSQQQTQLQLQCGSILLKKCSSNSVTQGRICPQWMITKGDRQMLQRSNFRVRLLVGCDGLEADAARFRRNNSSPTCTLCHTAPENARHFIIDCPALQFVRNQQLLMAPGILSTIVSSPNLLMDFLIGTSWVEDKHAQKFAVDYLHTLRLACARLLT